jgi:hypothetical protein
LEGEESTREKDNQADAPIRHVCRGATLTHNLNIKKRKEGATTLILNGKDTRAIGKKKGKICDRERVIIINIPWSSI